MRVRCARHKSLCFAAYLLRCGARERWRMRGRVAAPQSTVIVRRMIPYGSCPVVYMNQPNAPYLLHFFFYELGHFHSDGLLPVVSGAIAPVEKGDQSGRASGGFPLGWIHELRTRN